MGKFHQSVVEKVAIQELESVFHCWPGPGDTWTRRVELSPFALGSGLGKFRGRQLRVETLTSVGTFEKLAFQ